MKFSCLQENLSKGVQIVYRAVPVKSPLPILSNILVHAKNDRLRLSASNMETTISTYIGASIEQDGAITVPAKLIKDFVTNLSPDAIEANLVDETLHMKSEKTKSRFNGITAEDFPELPEMPQDITQLELNPSEFLGAVSMVSFAAGTDLSRPVYTGIYISYESGKLTFAALDGYRLAEKVIKVESEVENFTTIIPAKTMVELTRIFSDAEESIKMVLSESENLVLFSTDDTLVATRIIDGQYPDYKAIIPKETLHSAQFSAEEFLNAVRLTSVFAKDDNRAIRIRIDPEGLLRLSSLEEETGKHESEISAEVTGESLELTFNAKYLLDFLNNVKSETLTLATAGTLTPCIFNPEEMEDFTHIIMPMQI